MIRIRPSVSTDVLRRTSWNSRPMMPWKGTNKMSNAMPARQAQLKCCHSKNMTKTLCITEITGACITAESYNKQMCHYFYVEYLPWLLTSSNLFTSFDIIFTIWPTVVLARAALLNLIDCKDIQSVQSRSIGQMILITLRYISVQHATRIRNPIRKTPARLMWFMEMNTAEQSTIPAAQSTACVLVMSPSGFSKYLNTTPRKIGWLIRTTHSWNIKIKKNGKNSGKNVLNTAQAKFGFFFFNSFFHCLFKIEWGNQNEQLKERLICAPLLTFRVCRPLCRQHHSWHICTSREIGDRACDRWYRLAKPNFLNNNF